MSEISSGLVAVRIDTDGYQLVRLSDAEAIISDLQNLVIAENQRKQQLEEEVMWLKAAQPNIALIANKDATIAKQAAFIEEQKGTITALNIALGGEDSTSTENLVDAYEHDPESVGLCFKYRAAKDKILMQTERIKELTDDLEESDAIRDRCAHLLAETAVALKGPEKALHRHGWQDLPEVAAKQSAALKLASLALSEGVEYVEEPPERNCTCHLAPPCNDCVEHSAVREFFIEARKALAAIDALGE